VLTIFNLAAYYRGILTIKYIFKLHSLETKAIGQTNKLGIIVNIVNKKM